MVKYCRLFELGIGVVVNCSFDRDSCGCGGDLVFSSVIGGFRVSKVYGYTDWSDGVNMLNSLRVLDAIRFYQEMLCELN